MSLPLVTSHVVFLSPTHTIPKKVLILKVSLYFLMGEPLESLATALLAFEEYYTTLSLIMQ